MLIRYYLYVLGGISLFALFAYAYSTMYQLNRTIEGIDYISVKLVEYDRFSSKFTRYLKDKRALDKNHFAEEISNLINYQDAPIHLKKKASFIEIQTLNIQLQRLLSLYLSGDRTHQLEELQTSFNSTQKQLKNLYDQQILRLKQDISLFIWVCALLLVSSAAAIGIPFFKQSQKAVIEISKANNKLTSKANELHATHITMGNMLEDMVLERRQVTRASELNARLAAIINSSDDAILSLNLAGVIATANNSAMSLFGEDIIGKRLTQLFPDPMSEQLRSVVMTTGEQKTGTTCDLQIERDHHRIDLSATLSPIHSDIGELAGYSVILRDVSETKLEQEQFRMVVEASPNAMIMVNHHGFIVLINSEVENMFGYERQELYGHSVHMLVPENLRATHSQKFLSYFERPQKRAMGPRINELKGQKKNGERFPIEVGLTPITIDGEKFVISSIIDISERLKQQSTLQTLNDKLSRKNSEMEQFIYAVSHDLKAPLITIAGFAEGLLEVKEISENPKNKHKLNRIVSNVQSMNTLLQDLLSLSRVIKRDLEKELVDTESVVNKSIESLELNIKNANINVQVLCPLHPIYAQESMLLQCLQNLISNAIKYRNPNASTPYILISSFRNRDFCAITIEDNGIGISESHQNRIFNIFERLNPEVCEGNGVGLSIVKTIMDKHEGKIQLVSQEGTGSKFTLLFPISKSHASAYEPDAKQQASL